MMCSIVSNGTRIGVPGPVRSTCMKPWYLWAVQPGEGLYYGISHDGIRWDRGTSNYLEDHPT